MSAVRGGQKPSVVSIAGWRGGGCWVLGAGFWRRKLYAGFVAGEFGEGREFRRTVTKNRQISRTILFLAKQGDQSGGLVDSGRELGFRDRKSTRLNSSHLGISYAV